MGAERGKLAMKDESGLLNHDFIVESSKPYRDQPAIYFLIHGGEVVYVGRSSNVNLRIGHHINKQQKPFDRYYAVYCDVKDLNRTERESNLLERNFIAAAPNRIWLADITYVETDQGWLYLATVMDLYSRKIVGWAMCDHLRTDLPLAALRMAISAQRPGAGLIHHSDRGVQGGFKRSSQHPGVGGCDEHSKAAVG